MANWFGKNLKLLNFVFLSSTLDIIRMNEIKLKSNNIDVSKYYAFPIKMFSLNMSVIKAFETLGTSSSS